MAKLNLVTKKIDHHTIEVSWNDVKTLQSGGARSFALGMAIAIVVTLVGSIVVWANSGSPALFFLWLVVVIIYAITCLIKFPTPNSIKLGHEVTEHAGRKFPTAEITRFEYGLKSTMTGYRPKDNEPDVHIIRLWLNDSDAHEISANFWQLQENHNIRDALAKALDDLRKGEAKEKREEIHGTAGEYGVPDY